MMPRQSRPLNRQVATLGVSWRSRVPRLDDRGDLADLADPTPPSRTCARRRRRARRPDCGRGRVARPARRGRAPWPAADDSRRAWCGCAPGTARRWRRRRAAPWPSGSAGSRGSSRSRGTSVRAPATAAAMRSASATEIASGFWAETCLPAASAATIWSACIQVGVSSSTASTAESSSTCAKSE